ncbi:MAG TPA: von Willebrand factor type A domain-containing protein [Longimicrobiaceae bacterium]|nr:von Willebrand factor type A domain-containing protein [Longimicrobiaceae bacterium]
MRTRSWGWIAALALGAVATLAAVPVLRAGPRPDTVVVAGRVLDAASARPLPGATVQAAGTRRRTTSGADGAYRLVVARGAVRDGALTLQATLVGYEPLREEVRVTGGEVRRDLRLQPAALALEGVVVTGAEAARKGERHARVADAQAPRSILPSGMAPPPPPPPAYSSAPWNTEAYAYVRENGFLAADRNPLSTFSIDVDRASYSNVRRFLLDGQLPPKDAVRIEEMVNYFTYDHPEPRGEHPFTVVTDVAAAPWAPGHRLLRVGLHSPRVETGRLPPSNLVFLIDVSGSMQSPDKLPLVKQSLRMLVEQLRPQDRVALVVYAGAAGLVLPSTPGSERGRILDALERLEAGGSTAGGAGLRLAYEVARENQVRGGNNRVILATDGDFNVGVSSDAEMIRLVEEKRRQGTFLTVLGFGTGNLKDSKMEQMADHGNGNYAYVDNLLEARKVLVSEMGGTLLTVAKDVKLQVEFNPARVRAYRLIGYENRLLASEDFNDDRKDAGELGAGHSVTALYEVVPAGAATDAPVRGTDPLRYQSPARPGGGAGGGELAFVKVRYKQPAGERSLLMQHPVVERPGPPARDLSFAAAVAGFGMLLRESEHAGKLTPQQVLALARAARGDDPEGYRAEFIRLVELYGELRRTRGAGDHGR